MLVIFIVLRFVSYGLNSVVYHVTMRHMKLADESVFQALGHLQNIGEATRSLLLHKAHQSFQEVQVSHSKRRLVLRCQNACSPYKELVILKVRWAHHFNSKLLRCESLFYSRELIDVAQLSVGAVHIELKLVKSVILEYKGVAIPDISTPTLDSLLGIKNIF